MTRTNAQARRRLDTRLERIGPLSGEPTPHKGWIRAIRDALGMSGAELASRVGVSQQRISQIEYSEIHDTITLETLRRVAEGLDCDLHYVLQPRTSLDEAVNKQARRKAAQHLAPVAHHGRLEDQALAGSDEDDQREELAARFADRRGLWTEDPDTR